MSLKESSAVPFELVAAAHPDDPAFEMALTQAMLEAVAGRSMAETVRVYRPGPTVAFGRLDRLRPGFDAACRAAVAHGRSPVLRLGGGRAAAYDRDCIVIEVIRAQERLIGGLDERFADLVALLREGLAAARVPVEVGELAGEYCPGRFSLHLPGGPKVAGVAQRVIAGGSLTTAVLVVAGGDGLRATIADVYAALELPVDVATAGAVADRHPDVAVSTLEAGLRDLAARRYGAVAAQPPSDLVQRARELRATAAVADA
jgi:octanoyl-[GcvH]:protein N-octanoyltransferase